jgi:hypothetical protein
MSPLTSRPQVAPDPAGGAHTPSPEARVTNEVHTSPSRHPHPVAADRQVLGLAGSQARMQVKTLMSPISTHAESYPFTEPRWDLMAILRHLAADAEHHAP